MRAPSESIFFLSENNPARPGFRVPWTAGTPRPWRSGYERVWLEYTPEELATARATGSTKRGHALIVRSSRVVPRRPAFAETLAALRPFIRSTKHAPAAKLV